MQIKKLFTVTLMAGSTIATPVVKRDPKPITDALASISTAIKGMTTKVSAFSGDANEAADILTLSEGLIDTIKKSTASIQPLPKLELVEATKVLGPGNAIVADTEKTVDTLISKKPQFDQNQFSSVVQDTLKNISDVAKALVDQITTKLPPNVQSVGKTLGDRIGAALNKGLKAFS